MQPTNVKDLTPESYRKYLEVLARLNLHSHLHAVLSPSDLVQDTLAKAQRNLKTFRGQTQTELKAWLAGILRNTTKDHLRRLYPELHLRQVLEDSAARLEKWAEAEQATPSEHFAQQEKLQSLAEALGQLSEDERRAIEMRYLQQPRLSLEEISMQLNRQTPKAIANLLFRARKRLRHLLPDMED